MSTLPGVPPDIGKIVEPLLLAALLYWGLFGALSVQVYIYYLAFSNDPLQRKVLVYGVYVAEIAQMILYSQITYTTFAAGFGNIEAFNGGSSLLWFAGPILSTLVAFTVQMFYAYRIKIVAQSNLIPMVVVLFALLQVGGGIAQGVIGQKTTNVSNFLVKKALIATGISNASSAVCDIIIAASMTFYLSRMKSAWKPTQRKIQKLTRLIIETGTLTAAVAIINLILCLLPGGPTYYQTTSGILGIMYASTMMGVFNSRIVFSDHESAPDALLSSLAVSNPGESRRPPISASTRNSGISATREQWSSLDVYAGQNPKGLEADSDNVQSSGMSI